MDTIIEKKKGFKEKHIFYIIGGGILLFLVIWIFKNNSMSQLTVEKEKLSITNVEENWFNDYIRINGQVTPINTIQLSAIEGGMVEEKYIEEGAMIKKGDIILRLNNPMLNLNILDSEAQLAEKENFLRNTQVAMEQEKLNLKKEKLQLDLDVDRKKRKYLQYQQLYSENMISKEEYLQAKEDCEYALSSKTLVVERQKQDSLYRNIQIEQMEESLESIRKNMMLIRQRVENLSVKAPADGQLGLFDVEIGQTVSYGGKIGQINILSAYKIEASIDEHYIDKVKPGLIAVFDRQGKSFTLQVKKVYPQVREKLFKTDFIFNSELPDNIRTGQTYYIDLQLGEPTKSVIVPRGVFYQSTGGQWVYVVSPDNNRAVKRKITIGRQNPNQYEIVNGLQVGEKVITSSYDYFNGVEELILKQ